MACPVAMTRERMDQPNRYNGPYQCRNRTMAAISEGRPRHSRALPESRLGAQAMARREFPANLATFSQLWYSGPAVAEVKPLQIGTMTS